MKYLICGGAGYIGAHLAKWLNSRGHDVVVLDNLSTGHRAALRWGELVEVDIRDRRALFQALGQRQFDGVVHMCARSLVGESMELPYEYYENNVGGTLNVLEWMRHTSNDRFVFSSTAAIFGNPQTPLIDEQHPKAPINPYGRTKLMVEHLLEYAAKAYGLRSVSLRYFNACGADDSGEIGESHDPETHLIPNVLRSLLESRRRLKIFGTDYATADGTCVRDYVHVTDLASAHELALAHLQDAQGAHAFNLGNGNGFSVKQIIEAAATVVGRPIPYEVAPRREGDPAVLVASSAKAREVLGWRPRFADVRTILESAWKWHQNPRY